MRRNMSDYFEGKRQSERTRSKKILTSTIAGVLTAVLMLTCVMPVSAGPIVIDGDSDGSWEDNFKDTDGIETWDNLDLTAEGLRLTGIFEENFTGTDGSLPEEMVHTRRWTDIGDFKQLSQDRDRHKRPADLGHGIGADKGRLFRQPRLDLETEHIGADKWSGL
jgi:hypothetical protein